MRFELLRSFCILLSAMSLIACAPIKLKPISLDFSTSGGNEQGVSQIILADGVHLQEVSGRGAIYFENPSYMDYSGGSVKLNPGAYSLAVYSTRDNKVRFGPKVFHLELEVGETKFIHFILVEEGEASFLWVSDFSPDDPELETEKQLYRCKQEADEVAVGYCESLAETGNAEAMLRLSELYFESESLEPDEQKAFAYRKQAADLGNVRAQGWVGGDYLFGSPVPRDHSKAKDYLTQAAEGGNSFAISMLATSYLNGWFTKKDSTKAYDWAKVAISKGSMYRMVRGVATLLREAGNDPTLIGEAVAARQLLLVNKVLSPQDATEKYILEFPASKDGEIDIHDFLKSVSGEKRFSGLMCIDVSGYASPEDLDWQVNSYAMDALDQPYIDGLLLGRGHKITIKNTKKKALLAELSPSLNVADNAACIKYSEKFDYWSFYDRQGCECSQEREGR